MVSNIVYFHPYLGKIPILTNVFSNGLKPPTRTVFHGRSQRFRSLLICPPKKQKKTCRKDLAQRRGVRVHALDTSSFLRSCVGIAQEMLGFEPSETWRFIAHLSWLQDRWVSRVNSKMLNEAVFRHPRFYVCFFRKQVAYIFVENHLTMQFGDTGWLHLWCLVTCNFHWKNSKKWSFSATPVSSKLEDMV